MACRYTTCRWHRMLGAHDSKTSHCGCVAVTTWMVRGRRYRRTAASAARLMHVGFTATPAPGQALPWVSENSSWVPLPCGAILLHTTRLHWS